ncbi:MAG: hypothetical protein OXU36_06720 [Candidatus Poribacteria bacterium]|nr:hypothetical protein [Candidatus Poribacteria bacterium]
MAFPGYEARVGFRINGIYACGHRPGYECLMAFPGSQYVKQRQIVR